MGPCPSDGPDKFNGVDICNDPAQGFVAVGAGGKSTVCGCMTLGPTPVVIEGDQTLTLANIYMKAATYLDEAITVHISADEGMLQTTGGICEPDELTASGTGTAQGEYIKYSPPPPPPPPSPPPPPPPPTEPAACVKYGKCQWCDAPDVKCWYGGDGLKPAYGDTPADCFSSCAELASFVCEDGDNYVA